MSQHLRLPRVQSATRFRGATFCFRLRVSPSRTLSQVALRVKSLGCPPQLVACHETGHRGGTGCNPIVYCTRYLAEVHFPPRYSAWRTSTGFARRTFSYGCSGVLYDTPPRWRDPPLPYHARASRCLRIDTLLFPATMVTRRSQGGEAPVELSPAKLNGVVRKPSCKKALFRKEHKNAAAAEVNGLSHYPRHV